MSDLRPKVITVVGDGTHRHPDKTVAVAEWIAQSGHHLLTGGGGGVMEEVSRAFCESEGRRRLAVGITPGHVDCQTQPWRYQTKGWLYPNSSVELAIFTHLLGEDPESDTSRNHINILSADLIVALPGGAGTHAEIQLAKKYNKPVLLFLTEKDTILGKKPATLAAEGFTVIYEFPDLLQAANSILDPDWTARQPVRIQLKNAAVRSWRWHDAASLVQYANDRAVSRNLHDGFPSPYLLRDARRWLTRALSVFPETNFAIEVDGEAAGGIGFHPKEGLYHRSAEVGYWLGQAHWGRGIATDALSNITDYAFRNFSHLSRLYAHVFDWNVASMRVLEKAGFTREGVLRKSAQKAGRVIDMILYSRIRE